VVEGSRGRGRSGKTWNECVVEDVRKLRLKIEVAQDRAA